MCCVAEAKELSFSLGRWWSEERDGRNASGNIKGEIVWNVKWEIRNVDLWKVWDTNGLCRVRQ